MLKKILKKKNIFFLSLLIGTLSFSLNAHLTLEEQQAFIANHQPPQEIKAKLDQLFGNESIKNFFINFPRFPLVANKLADILPKISKLSLQDQEGFNQKYTQAKIQETFTKVQQAQQAWQQCVIPNLATLSQQFGFEVFVGNTINLVFKDLPNPYIVKINRFEWPSKYQNVSRVFHNDLINKFIAEQEFCQILPNHKYLYHIPGQPEELNDDNYIVITDFFIGLDREKNLENFSKLDLNIEENKELLLQLKNVIEYAKLWDINNLNLYLLGEENDHILAFIYTEQDGLGMPLYTEDPIYSDENFFLQGQFGQMRGERCAGCGLNGLKTLLGEKNYNKLME